MTIHVLIHRENLRETMQRNSEKSVFTGTDALLAWGAIFAVLEFAVILLNSLALYIFIKNKSLRTRKHFMIINLVVSDFLFGVTGLSLAIFYVLDPSKIAFYVFNLLNKFTKTASLLTLGLIALERMHAIVWPFRHRVLRIYIYKAALVFAWALSAALTAIMSLKMYNVRFEAVLLATVFFVTIETAASYITLWVFIKRRRPQHDTSTSQDKALAFTLLLISGAFVVTWVIPVLFISIPRICTTCHQPKGSVIMWLHIAFAFQSVINPVIYCFRIPGFQDTLKAKIKQMNFFGKRMQQQPTENDMRDYK